MTTFILYRTIFFVLLICLLALAACGTPLPQPPVLQVATLPGEGASAPTQVINKEASTLDGLIPKPVSLQTGHGFFDLTTSTVVLVEPGNPELMAIGEYLVDKLRPSTGFPLQVQAAGASPAAGNILLTITHGDARLGEEGYSLSITSQGVRLSAYRPAGLFHGLQTLRQLLPASAEMPNIQPGPWSLPAAEIRDYPRFSWRGSMLDVSRHFFSVQDVERYIDLIAYYKLNTLHLHLSDDQGWRLEIKSWPQLAKVGGSTQVGGGPGGYYTQDEYSQIVQFAQSRYITIVPEFDMPGHTNAALASYAELTCNDQAPSLYTGTNVGFSSFCVGKEITYSFLNDVIKELAALTPGPYIHIGGDEVQTLTPSVYINFIQRVQEIVAANGKQMIGWEEIAQANLEPSSIIQHWNPGNRGGELPQKAVRAGVKLVMSPADLAYMDMKYDKNTPLGLDWAGMISVAAAYKWDPVPIIKGLQESDVLGVEATLFSETLQNLSDIETMAFPRLPGYAELGWSPAGARGWDQYKLSLGMHAPRLAAMGVQYYPAPEVPWTVAEPVK